MSEKKSFLLYLDMYPHIALLPAEQRGELLSALFEFAAEEAAKPGASMAGRPQMTSETQMAFSFMAETIRRDTEKWREKHARYVKAALERNRGKAETAWEVL